jgi:serine/threonine-protein kinase RsbW
MSDIVKLMVPGKPEYVSTVRLAISALAVKVGFDIDAIDDIKVAVGEACTNIVSHSDIGDARLYRITCEIADDSLQITVEDEGAGFEISEYKQPDLTALNESGMGIYIIRALMDEVVVASEKNSGTCIRMKKYLARQTQ